jgi:S1-C subfamily serine protease
VGFSQSSARTLAFLCLAAVAGVAGAHDVSPSVVRIRAVDGNGSVRHGSGVVIAPGEVVTACHVTRGAASIEIEHGGLKSAVTAQVGSEQHDLCVLRAPTEAVPIAARRGSAELQPGETVIAVGFERGERPIAMRGHVAALYAYDDGPVVRTDAPFDFGSSGGGLFDEAGDLVGILAFKARTGENLRFALPTEWLRPDSRVAGAFVPIAATARGVAFWERARGDRPDFLGVALREAAAP